MYDPTFFGSFDEVDNADDYAQKQQSSENSNDYDHQRRSSAFDVLDSNFDWEGVSVD